MTEKVGQWIFMQCCIKLEHSSALTIWMIQKAVAVGNWWLAASSKQCARSRTTCRFWRNIKSPRWLSPPYSPDLAPCDFWLFLKLKSPLKGKRFQTINEIQENMMGQLMAIGRTVWGLKVPIEASLSCVQCFLYLLSSSINVSVSHVIWLNTFST